MEKIEVSDGETSVEILETEDADGETTGLRISCDKGQWCDVWAGGYVEIGHDYNEAINEASIHVARHVAEIVRTGK